MRLLLSDLAQDDLERLSSDDFSQVIDELEHWADSRNADIIYSDTRKVRSVDQDIRVAKVGDSRIFFSEDRGKIIVLSVANRADFDYQSLHGMWKPDE